MAEWPAERLLSLRYSISLPPISGAYRPDAQNKLLRAACAFGGKPASAKPGVMVCRLFMPPKQQMVSVCKDTKKAQNGQTVDAFFVQPQTGILNFLTGIPNYILKISSRWVRDSGLGTICDELGGKIVWVAHDENVASFPKQESVPDVWLGLIFLLQAVGTFLVV